VDASASSPDYEWEIEGRARLTHADFLDAWLYVPAFRTVWLYAAFFPFGLGLMVLGSPVPARDWLPQVPWLVLGAPLTILAIWWWRRRWAEASFTRIGSRQLTFRLDHQGLHVDSSLGRQKYPWAQLVQPIETKQGLLLPTSATQLLLLPKRAFSADDLQDVTRLLGELPARRGSNPPLLRLVLLWAAVVTLLLVAFRLFVAR